MIFIKKGNEPESLTEYRSSTPDAHYNGLHKDQLDAIRDSLLEEQGYLCAYCMKRINKETMKIEHWKSQNDHDGTGQNLDLDYSNMLGVCDGNMGSKYDAQTCDAHKGNTELTVNPTKMFLVRQIKYKNDGTIYSEDIRIDKDLNETLNLNSRLSYQLTNRKRALETVQRYLISQCPTGKWKPALLHKTRVFFETKSNEKYKEYIGIILYYLDKYMH